MMIIAFGNSKGGVGVSTLALLMANYLSGDLSRRVSLIELKANGPLEEFAHRSRLLEHEVSFDFFCCDLSHLSLLLSKVNQMPGSIVLLDLPELSDDRIITFIAQIDRLIIPFSYDLATLRASIHYASLCKRIKASLALVFVPSRINRSVKYPCREQSDQVLRKIGSVSPAILTHIGFQRICSLEIPAELMRKVNPLLELIRMSYLEQSD